MDTGSWIAVITVAATGVGVYASIREAISELRTGFSGVLKLLEKQDERITYIEQRSMVHHPLRKDEN